MHHEDKMSSSYFGEVKLGNAQNVFESVSGTQQE